PGVWSRRRRRFPAPGRSAPAPPRFRRRPRSTPTPARDRARLALAPSPFLSFRASGFGHGEGLAAYPNAGQQAAGRRGVDVDRDRVAVLLDRDLGTVGRDLRGGRPAAFGFATGGQAGRLPCGI